MKRQIAFIFFLLILTFTAVAQTVNEGILSLSLSLRGDGANITMDSKPEQVVEFLLQKYGGKYCLYPRSELSVHKTQTDKYGNHHVVYNQLLGIKAEFYQTILHFRPDGSLYYVNGKLAVAETAELAKAKPYGERAKLTAAEAALIATGDSASEAYVVLTNYQNVPREAYKVHDCKMMRYAYVDAFSGELLFTVPMYRHFAPWDELHGTSATLTARTSYNGIQSLDVMQTDKGYVLRDPKRNIVTVDATDKLDDYPKSFPYGNEQGFLLMDTSDDFVFTDKQQLLNTEYTTALNRVEFSYYTWGEDKPASITMHAYYVDEDGEALDDIIKLSFGDTAWVREFSKYHIVYNLPQPISVNVLDGRHRVEFIYDGVTYSGKNLLVAGNKKEYTLKTDEIGAKKLGCMLNVGVDASQPALDVHWGIQQVYDMYHDYFGISGCDNKGSQIVNIVNPTNKLSLIDVNGLPNNAFAMPGLPVDSNGVKSYLMVYGLGATGYDKYMTSLDLVAHEYTHNVNTGCGNDLQYRNESGALDEALADCMAMVTEYYALGQPSWLMNEDISLNRDNMRNYRDPWLSGAVDGEISAVYAQPKYYKGLYWLDYTADDFDHGGVHINSGVFNYLFYLLCEGAQSVTNEMGRTHDIQPIGMDRMKDILFQTIMYYNSGFCDYDEIGANLLIAVEDIWRQTPEAARELQQMMLTAFEHVGMSPTISPTGIVSHTLIETESRPNVYDLNGHLAPADYKGVVIKGGKAVKVK